MHRQSFFLVPLICLSSALWAAPATVNVEVLQDKLDHPWALAFLPDNHGMLITLRGGELRHWQAGKGLSAPLSGVPDVWAHGQGGLLDVVLAPDFAQSRRIWLSYSEVGDDGKAGTAVGYGRLSDDLSKVTDFRTVFRQMPKLSTGNHYGWPLATWGINYSGFKIPEAKGEIVAGTEQPVFYWKDSPAVSGMAFYNSDKFPQWQQKLFIGALKDKDVIVMSVNGDKVTEDGRILTDRGQRIRDVRTGPDGYLYVLTDESSGELLKVSPRN
ncbi:PQQ-dependent sugar dehydrogenase [Shigella sonnei]|nr:PQQ-dependent sugar dehydrogenase [Shigella sonnei]EFW3249048.1 PQQ-dependent sugar dehydrogenase [Shigella sonnei]EFY1469580.1 PQQ-dependent sugar dehydrogenase [Shigella sonnei]EFY9337927.1 PQQ-dependent sugar dehydrogenase [Shigella sonnei]